MWIAFSVCRKISYMKIWMRDSHWEFSSTSIGFQCLANGFGKRWIGSERSHKLVKDRSKQPLSASLPQQWLLKIWNGLIIIWKCFLFNGKLLNALAYSQTHLLLLLSSSLSLCLFTCMSNFRKSSDFRKFPST